MGFMRSSIAIALVAVSVLLGGCQMQAMGPQSYVPLDFRKLASGMFADELVGKAVVAEGFYQPNTMATMEQGASRITFFVRDFSPKAMSRATEERLRAARSPSEKAAVQIAISTEAMTGMMSLGLLTASAPRAMRDVLFTLQDDDPIRVYGRIASTSMFSRIDRQATGISSLHLNVDRVERR